MILKSFLNQFMTKQKYPYTTGQCTLAHSGEPLRTAMFVGTLAKASTYGGSETMLTRKDCSIFFTSCFGNVYTTYWICYSIGLNMTKFNANNKKSYVLPQETIMH